MRQNLPVIVETYNENDPDTIITSRTINHADADKREWLIRHIHWAMRNGHGVDVHPVIEETAAP